MTVRYVFIHLPGDPGAVPAGKLTIASDSRSGEFLNAEFQYGARYLQRANALPVDPVSLPFGGEMPVIQRPANGLPMFGAIRDASPDMWGRQVIENRLRRRGPLPEWMYLDHAGSDRGGALDIRRGPESEPATTILPGAIDLSYLLEAADRIEAGEPVPAQLEYLFQGAPTMGGMRPKAVITVDARQFIAKLPSQRDRFNVPAVERATLELAREAGLDVPETRLEKLPDGREVMLIERFDRQAGLDGLTRRHMVSALTMLGVSEMDSPSMRYTDIADVISARAPRDRVQSDREELFGRMVFNILVSNSDDHLRNHAFLYDAEASGWQLSPLYDVVPTPSQSLERDQHLTIGDMGRAARLDNALTSAGQFNLLRPEAARIIDRIHRVARQWRITFEAKGVSVRDCDYIESAFLHARHLGMDAVLAAMGA